MIIEEIGSQNPNYPKPTVHPFQLVILTVKKLLPPNSKVMRTTLDIKKHIIV